MSFSSLTLYLLFLFTIKTNVHAAPAADCTLYASPTVADGSKKDGKTIANAVSFKDAERLTVPGSVVCLLDGIYSMTSPLYPSHAGTANAWIKYKPYNPGQVLLRWDSTSKTSYSMIHLRTETNRRVEYIEFNGLKLDGKGYAAVGFFCQTAPAIATSGPYPHHLRFINNTIENMGAAGIASKYCDYLTSIGNKIYKIGNTTGWGSGISYNTNVWIDTNGEFHNIIVNNIISGVYDCCGRNRVDDPGVDTDITDGNGIIIDRSASGDNSPPTLIANNLVYQNGGRCIHIFHGHNNCVINNSCYKNGLDLLVGSDGDSINHVAEFNVSYSKNNYHINNIVQSWTNRYAFQEGTVGSSTYMYNMWYEGKGITNIPNPSDTKQFINANSLYKNPPTVNPDETVGEQYKNAVSPVLIGDRFTLQINSPAINAGIDPRTINGHIVMPNGQTNTDLTKIRSAIDTYLLTDLAGNARPSDGKNWDLGAYESTFTCDLLSQGDADCNNKIDVVDFTCWRVQYLTGIIPASCKDGADFNSSGKVDLLDFSIWKTRLLERL